jgi:hypothetical protein
MRDARMMVDVGEAIVETAKARDIQALENLNDRLYNACVVCHQDYRPKYRALVPDPEGLPPLQTPTSKIAKCHGQAVIAARGRFGTTDSRRAKNRRHIYLGACRPFSVKALLRQRRHHRSQQGRAGRRLVTNVQLAHVPEETCASRGPANRAAVHCLENRPRGQFIGPVVRPTCSQMLDLPGGLPAVIMFLGLIVLWRPAPMAGYNLRHGLDLHWS